jgi:hypothetical protein
MVRRSRPVTDRFNRPKSGTFAREFLLQVTPTEARGRTSSSLAPHELPYPPRFCLGKKKAAGSAALFSDHH